MLALFAAACAPSPPPDAITPVDWTDLGPATATLIWSVGDDTFDVTLASTTDTAFSRWSGYATLHGRGDGTDDGVGRATLDLDAALNAPLQARIATDAPTTSGCETGAMWTFDATAALTGAPGAATMRLDGEVWEARTCEGEWTTTRVVPVAVTGAVEPGAADSGDL
jgi:hypothetical protein